VAPVFNHVLGAFGYQILGDERPFEFILFNKSKQSDVLFNSPSIFVEDRTEVVAIFFAALMRRAEVTVAGSGEKIEGNAFPLEAVSRRFITRLRTITADEIEKTLDFLLSPLLPGGVSVKVDELKLEVEEAQLFGSEDGAD
jgi:hypothetical protein